MKLDGMIARIDGSEILRSSATGKPDSAEETGIKLARELISLGADRLIKEARGC